MTTQLEMWLPERMVAFLDRSVASGKAPIRAALVALAIERETRRQTGCDDARVLAQVGPADDLDDVVAWSQGQATLEG